MYQSVIHVVKFPSPFRQTKSGNKSQSVLTVQLRTQWHCN